MVGAGKGPWVLGSCRGLKGVMGGEGSEAGVRLGGSQGGNRVSQGQDMTGCPAETEARVGREEVKRSG